MEISKKIELDYGHTLPKHYSFCNQIHGHRASIVATVEGNVNQIQNDSNQGMVYDFKILKELMIKKIHNILDHGFAVWEDDSVDLEFIIQRNQKYIITKQPPTAECLAEWAYNQIQQYLPSHIKLKSVEWFETPSSMARYE